MPEAEEQRAANARAETKQRAASATAAQEQGKATSDRAERNEARVSSADSRSQQPPSLSPSQEDTLPLDDDVLERLFYSQDRGLVFSDAFFYMDELLLRYGDGN